MTLLKKVIFGLMLAFLATSTLFVGIPANAASGGTEPASIEDAPRTYYIKGVACSRQYVFYSVLAYGHLYRGYLNRFASVPTIGSVCHGYLYREDLPYPTPSIKKPEDIVIPKDVEKLF